MFVGHDVLKRVANVDSAGRDGQRGRLVNYEYSMLYIICHLLVIDRWFCLLELAELIDVPILHYVVFIRDGIAILEDLTTLQLLFHEAVVGLRVPS